jgi:hypothetical protein
MLLHQPTPDAVPDIEVEGSKLTACAGAEAIVISPSPQNGTEPPKKLRQRQAEHLNLLGPVRLRTGPSLDPSALSSAIARARALRNFAAPLQAAKAFGNSILIQLEIGGQVLCSQERPPINSCRLRAPPKVSVLKGRYDPRADVALAFHPSASLPIFSI